MIQPIHFPPRSDLTVPLLPVAQNFAGGEGYTQICASLESIAGHRRQTEEELSRSFGERPRWPKAVEEGYSQLERAEQEIRSVTDRWREGAQKLFQDMRQPASKESGIEMGCRFFVGQTRLLIGPLSPEEESLLPKNFPVKPKNLFDQYHRRAENLEQQVKKSLASPFELTGGKRKNLQGILTTRIPEWEKDLAAVATEAEREDGPEEVEKCRQKIEALFSVFRKEAAYFLDLPNNHPDAESIYKKAINAKNSAGAKLETARQSLKAWKRQKSAPAIKAAQTPTDLAQEAATLVAIPEEEYAQSLELTYPPFRERVRALIEEGTPLRRWVDGDSRVAIIFDERFGTAFHVPVQSGWVLPGAKAFMPLLHGGGGAESNGKTMIQPALKLRGKKYLCSAISFDCPNYGHAFRDPGFENLQKYLEWLDSVFRYFRFLTRGRIPLIAVGRSHGENTLQEYILRHPSRLDGIIGVSGYMPGWFLSNLPNFRKNVAEGDFKLNREGFAMAMAHEGLLPVVPEGRWEELKLNPHPGSPNQWSFPEAAHEDAMDLPMLLLTDRNDPEHKNVPDFVRIRENFAKQRQAAFLTTAFGLHDLLLINNNRDTSSENSARIATVYAEIGEFVDKIARYWRP